ncbi:hypothetical protein [Streptomyces sp. NPDC003327]
MFMRIGSRPRADLLASRALAAAALTVGSLSLTLPLATAAPAAAVSRPAPPVRAELPELAETGGNAERLWLLGGLGAALAGTGIVAKAAMRGRRDL